MDLVIAKIDPLEVKFGSIFSKTIFVLQQHIPCRPYSSTYFKNASRYFKINKVV